MSETLVTAMELWVYHRPKGGLDDTWFELDRGPGIIHFPEGEEIQVRARLRDDAELKALVKELDGLKQVVYLNLSENRSVTDEGLKKLTLLKHLQYLNLSSCDVGNQGMPYLEAFTRLIWLDLSFCNRITDDGLKFLKKLNNLLYLSLQGCVKTSHGGIVRLARPTLQVKR